MKLLYTFIIFLAAASMTATAKTAPTGDSIIFATKSKTSDKNIVADPDSTVLYNKILSSYQIELERFYDTFPKEIQEDPLKMAYLTGVLAGREMNQNAKGNKMVYETGLNTETSDHTPYFAGYVRRKLPRGVD